MIVPPLCILQARLHSSRIEHKMLRLLGHETLIERGYRLACEAFGKENVVVATPSLDGPNELLGIELKRIGATVFEYHGEESDVLGRFHACAHHFRWSPASVIFRWTPDDPFKDPASCRRVAAGERLPVEIGGEAFTLAMLDEAHALYRTGPGYADRREHLTLALFPGSPPPPCPLGCWTIDNEEDLPAARARLAELEG